MVGQNVDNFDIRVDKCIVDDEEQWWGCLFHSSHSLCDKD